jgi:tetratricopeptide (TPR) repeat protein
LNKPDEALEDLEKALDQNPNSIMVLTDMGVVYGRQGKYQQAIEMFHKALNIYPDYKDALFNLGKTYYAAGMYYEALNSLSQCKSNVENKQLNDQIELVKAKLEEARIQGGDTIKP